MDVRLLLCGICWVYVCSCGVSLSHKKEETTFREQQPLVSQMDDNQETPFFHSSCPASACRIILRDSITGENYTLAVLAGGKPVVVDLSASWCAPCVELTSRLATLHDRFGGRVRFFMLLQKGDAVDRLPSPPPYPVYFLEKAPPDLAISPPSLMPTVLMVGSDGEVRTVLAGLYPTLVYYSAIADLVEEGL